MAHTKKHHAHRVSTGLHYTVVLGLIVSLIATFFLGMILADTLWGSGLGYFNRVSHEGKELKLYQQQVKRWNFIHSAQAAERSFQYRMNGLTYTCTL